MREREYKHPSPPHLAALAAEEGVVARLVERVRAPHAAERARRARVLKVGAGAAQQPLAHARALLALQISAERTHHRGAEARPPDCGEERHEEVRDDRLQRREGEDGDETTRRRGARAVRSVPLSAAVRRGRTTEPTHTTSCDGRLVAWRREKNEMKRRDEGDATKVTAERSRRDRPSALSVRRARTRCALGAPAIARRGTHAP